MPANYLITGMARSYKKPNRYLRDNGRPRISS